MCHHFFCCVIRCILTLELADDFEAKTKRHSCSPSGDDFVRYHHICIGEIGSFQLYFISRIACCPPAMQETQLAKYHGCCANGCNPSSRFGKVGNHLTHRQVLTQLFGARPSRQKQQCGIRGVGVFEQRIGHYGYAVRPFYLKGCIDCQKSYFNACPPPSSGPGRP